MQRLLVLKLWPIVETSVMSENDGITLRQTAPYNCSATRARYVRWFTSFEEKDTIIRFVSKSKPSCYHSGAGPYDTNNYGAPGEGYIILVWAK